MQLALCARWGNELEGVGEAGCRGRRVVASCRLASYQALESLNFRRYWGGEGYDRLCSRLASPPGGGVRKE